MSRDGGGGGPGTEAAGDPGRAEAPTQPAGQRNTHADGAGLGVKKQTGREPKGTVTKERKEREGK